ncbi:MAG: DUF4956 domain-containing protein [Lachnospiraceae bacterium]|jgi:uncharacterized membrane protein YhiD involved in acid resistance|nr:DUF4956 domain-containing protein [Lachnospiraceae bacterium]
MFTSILDTASGTLSLTSAAYCIGAALVLGIIISLVYMYSSEKYTKNFVVTMALLPVLVMAVILMTSGSLGTAVAVLGTFSLVRFRSVPGTSKEITGIFFAMAVGLACGMGQILFAAIITVVISLIFVILNKTKFGEKNDGEKHLKITIPENLDYTGLFNDIFEKYTSTAKLDKAKTVNLGSMYELDYSIALKNPQLEKAMIDEIRTRNGNLSISCSRISENSLEL